MEDGLGVVHLKARRPGERPGLEQDSKDRGKGTGARIL